MTTIEGSKIKNENIILKWLYGRGVLKPHPKFKLNKMVHVARYRKMFDKGYFPNWTEEYYRVSKIENTLPPVYKLSDMKYKALAGSFYGHKLQKILIDINVTK